MTNGDSSAMLTAVKFKQIFSELDRNSWLNGKARIYALGDGLYFTGHPLHLFRHTMAQYYLAATNPTIRLEKYF